MHHKPVKRGPVASPGTMAVEQLSLFIRWAEKPGEDGRINASTLCLPMETQGHRVESHPSSEAEKPRASFGGRVRHPQAS